jgi:AhpD family alkylhydroperoxidase
MMEPRLAPIEVPKGLMMKIAYAMSRRMLGKVMMPMKVAYARVPALTRVSVGIARTMERKLTLDPDLRLLITAQTSALNGCGFCLDMSRAMAVQEGIGLEKFNALSDYATDPLFDARERAALDYAGQATRDRAVSDETFERLQAHFNEQEIVEITFVNAAENFYNLIGVPLGLESDGLCAIAQTRHPGVAGVSPLRSSGAATRSEALRTPLDPMLGDIDFEPHHRTCVRVA